MIAYAILVLITFLASYCLVRLAGWLLSRRDSGPSFEITVPGRSAQRRTRQAGAANDGERAQHVKRARAAPVRKPWGW